MTNADKFKHLFGIYATELWAMPENDFLEWLNADAQDMPTEEQRTGRWLTSDDMYETGICSCCRYDTQEPVSYVITNFEYCPNCGARMEGET